VAALTAGHQEQAELLGPRRSLLAIATRPTGSVRGAAPAVVFLNTGIVHHIGHHRMYVTLARMLAKRGHTAVRFDLSGLGDSAPRNDGVAPLVANLEDIRIVLDWLEDRYGMKRVVLVGLCSGADHSVLYSRSDPRVAGMVLMDPSLPPTRRYYYHYLVQRLGHLKNWLSVLTGRSGILRLLLLQLRSSRKPDHELRTLTLQDLPFSPYLRQCYQRAADRRVRLLTVFTSISARHTYHRQILDAFPEAAAGGALRLEYFESSDHLFSDPGERTRLYRAIIDWLDLDCG
jgi:pimeloyl-ACP methyl ester carboxylesterase